MCIFDEYLKNILIVHIFAKQKHRVRFVANAENVHKLEKHTLFSLTNALFLCIILA